MTATAIIATQLNTHAAHPYGLFLNGLDVIKEPVTGRYAVPVESIVVVEAGSGGISSMSFAIDDSQRVINIGGNEEVVLWDFTRDVPMFGGYIDGFAESVDFGTLGRTWTINCSGYETLLDTCAVPNLVLNFSTASRDPSGTALTESDMLQVVAGFSPLGSFASTTVTAAQATPIANRKRRVHTDGSVDFSGQSVRAAFLTFLGACINSNGSFVPSGVGKINEGSAADDGSVWLTVDFYKGVQFNWYLGTTQGPGAQWFSDYATLTITDSSVGAIAAEDLTYTEDWSPSAIVNGVYVVGGNAAGSGFVGTGRLPRREVSISSSSSTTGEGRSGAANVQLGGRVNGAGRGSFSLTSYTPTNGIHPGSPLAISEPAIVPNQGASVKYMITEIRKTLNPGLTQNWTISFMSIVDRLTGNTLVGSNVSGPQSAMATIKAR